MDKDFTVFLTETEINSNTIFEQSFTTITIYHDSGIYSNDEFKTKRNEKKYEKIDSLETQSSSRINSNSRVIYLKNKIYLSASKQLSNKLNKKSLENPREILLKFCLSNIPYTLSTTKYDLKKLNDLRKCFSEPIYSSIYEYSSIFNRKIVLNKISCLVTRRSSRIMSNSNRISSIKSDTCSDIINNDITENIIKTSFRLELSPKFTYDKATHEYLKNIYNNIDTIKYSFDDVRDYTNNIIKIFYDNIHNKQFINIIVEQKQIDTSTKLLLDCTMTILSINCYLSDGNEEFIQQIVNYGNIFDTLKQILQQLGQIMQPFSFAEQLFENVILLLSNIYRYHRSSNDPLWITRMTQYFHNRNDIIKICCSLIIASLFTNENRSKDYYQMKQFLKDQLDEAEKNKETEWNGFSVVELQEGYSKL